MRRPEPSDPRVLDAAQTAALLPYPELAQELHRMLLDDSVQVPARLV